MQYHNNKTHGKIASLAEKYSARRQHLAQLKFIQQACKPKNYNMVATRHANEKKTIKTIAALVRKKIKIES